MRCGAKCFIAEIELDGEKKIKPVIARTPAAVRKTIRAKYGKDIEIFSVRAEENAVK